MQSLPLSQQEAARELLRRRQARNQLIAFTEYTNAGYRAAAHHRLIAEKLEAVERGEIPRLMIFMPPRHGKSELASRRFPAWFLGRNPDRQVIAASYNSDLAGDFGRDVRNIVASPEYAALFDVQLAADSKAANRWHTSGGGMYVAAGVGTAITGRGAHLALIDDPFKDQEEADSQVIREKVWAWYQTVLRTRLMPGGAIILIQTRWHEDDLAGRLLESQGDKWDVLSLPALNPDGSSLWPEWYPPDVMCQLRDELAPRYWNALYQQSPIAEEGVYFKREWFEFYDELPDHLHFYVASDYAVTDGGGDWTEHGVAGVSANSDLYLADWWSGQTTPDVWIDAFLDLVKAHNPLGAVGESGQIRRAVEPFLARRMDERGIYCRMEWISRTKDKAAMARAFQALASRRKVFLPRKQWAYDLLSQLLAFPGGKFDDKVDVCALLGMIVDQMVPGFAPAKQARTKRDRWDKVFSNDDDSDNWKVA